MQNQATTEQTAAVAPLYIYVDIMYRDAGNWKTGESYLLKNSQQISEEEIRDCFDVIGKGSVLCRKWGLPNHAPTDHELLPTEADDHCYNEICDIDFLYSEEDKKKFFSPNIADNDISVVVEACKNGGTKEWFKYDEQVRRELMSDSIRRVEDAGFKVVKKNDIAKLENRALPEGLSPRLVQSLALMALSNPTAFRIAVAAGDKPSDLHAAQAIMSKALGI